MRRSRIAHATATLTASLMAATLIAMLGPGANAQTGSTAPAGTPLVVETDYAATEAEVVAVDRNDRTVVLVAPDGSQVTVEVGKEARNFDQIEPGDNVKVQFITSTAVSLREANQPPSDSESQMVQLAPRGAQPGGVVVDTRQITATVDDIDHQNRMVTLTGPRANTVSFKVGDNVQNFADIKKGDQVVVRYTEAVALSVDK